MANFYAVPKSLLQLLVAGLVPILEAGAGAGAIRVAEVALIILLRIATTAMKWATMHVIVHMNLSAINAISLATLHVIAGILLSLLLILTIFLRKGRNWKNSQELSSLSMSWQT